MNCGAIEFKFVLNDKFPFLHRFDTSLPQQVEKLKREAESLRARLVAAQEARIEAEMEAEQLRKEKERVRIKATLLKQELRNAERRHKRLVAKLEELQALLRAIEPWCGGSSSTSGTALLLRSAKAASRYRPKHP
jgi:predicted RNase H-like nuclease (RuvC/YqgF family)